MPRPNKIVPKRVMCTNPKRNKIAGGNDCKRVWGIADSLTKETAMNKETTMQKGSQDKSSFTPGPWEASPSRKSCDWHVYETNKVMIAICDRSTTTENEANARLIATAPELLEALKLWRDSAADLTVPAGYRMVFAKIIDKSELAIAKAEGATTQGRDA